jgi:Histidine kinase-, DNA gyrase B-, and HSP90-like ATPase
MGELTAAFQSADDKERRSTIERIVTSYRHPWDIYAELIQNAVDAIRDEADAKGPGEHLGDLRISVDTDARRITVHDNGVGISSDKIGMLIATGKSLKRDMNNRYGFMGFGLTFVAFQSMYLRIESVHDGNESVRTYHDLYLYPFGVSLLPEADEDGGASQVVTKPNGTTITVAFPPRFPREDKERDLAQLFEYAKNGRLMDAALRTKTAVGNVDKIFGRPVAETNVTFECNGESRTVEYKFLDYAEVLADLHYSDSEVKSLTDFEEIIRFSEPDSAERQQQFRKRAAIFEKKVDQVVGQRDPLNFDAYFFVTSKSHFGSFNSAIGADAMEADDEDQRAGWGVEGGVFLAISGMPTSIRLDHWTHPDLYPFTVLINARNISRELDAGRKGISAYRRDQIMTYVIEEIDRMKLRQHKRYIVANRPPRNPLADPKRDAVDSFDKACKAVSPHTIVYLPPCEEQEVVAIFYDLLGRGVLRGYAVKRQSTRLTYDALMDYEAHADERMLYDRTLNPLGMIRQTFQNAGGVLRRSEMLVEFKYGLDELYGEIQRVGHSKDLSEIDLLVCWSVVSDAVQRHGDVISPILASQRQYFGSTHLLQTPYRGKPLQIIALEAVLSDLAV